jgi:hypothetical protein
MDAGHLIAIDVAALYITLSPLLLLAIYVLFDSLTKPDITNTMTANNELIASDPALWTDDDLNRHIDWT